MKKKIVDDCPKKAHPALLNWHTKHGRGKLQHYTQVCFNRHVLELEEKEFLLKYGNFLQMWQCGKVYLFGPLIAKQQLPKKSM